VHQTFAQPMKCSKRCISSPHVGYDLSFTYGDIETVFLRYREQYLLAGLEFY